MKYVPPSHHAFYQGLKHDGRVNNAGVDLDFSFGDSYADEEKSQMGYELELWTRKNWSFSEY